MVFHRAIPPLRNTMGSFPWLLRISALLAALRAVCSRLSLYLFVLYAQGALVCSDRIN